MLEGVTTAWLTERAPREAARGGKEVVGTIRKQPVSSFFSLFPRELLLAPSVGRAW